MFPGSRLAVRHVGEMLARGADRAEVREDDPDLGQRDIACVQPGADRRADPLGGRRGEFLDRDRLAMDLGLPAAGGSG